LHCRQRWGGEDPLQKKRGGIQRARVREKQRDQGDWIRIRKIPFGERYSLIKKKAEKGEDQKLVRGGGRSLKKRG